MEGGQEDDEEEFAGIPNVPIAVPFARGLVVAAVPCITEVDTVLPAVDFSVSTISAGAFVVALDEGQPCSVSATSPALSAPEAEFATRLAMPPIMYSDTDRGSAEDAGSRMSPRRAECKNAWSTPGVGESLAASMLTVAGSLASIAAATRRWRRGPMHIERPVQRQRARGVR